MAAASLGNLAEVGELEELLRCVPLYILFAICDTWKFQRKRPWDSGDFIRQLKDANVSRDAFGRELYERGCADAGMRIFSDAKKCSSLIPKDPKSVMDLKQFQHPMNENWSWIENLLHQSLSAKEIYQLCGYLEVVAPKGVTSQHAIALFRLPKTPHSSTPSPRVVPEDIKRFLYIMGKIEAADALKEFI